jgi:hypothetical protein
MKRLVTLQLIVGYLFMTLILSHVHNHPLTEPENDSCPAFIISSVLNSDDVPTDLTQVAAMEFTGTYIPLFTSVLYPQTTIYFSPKRAPPVWC